MDDVVVPKWRLANLVPHLTDLCTILAVLDAQDCVAPPRHINDMPRRRALP